MQNPFVNHQHGKSQKNCQFRRQIVIDNHKSGKRIQKLHKWLNIALSTVRATIQKNVTFEMVTNLPGRLKYKLWKMVRKKEPNDHSGIGVNKSKN